jgi:hypothetical protein
LTTKGEAGLTELQKQAEERNRQLVERKAFEDAKYQQQMRDYLNQIGIDTGIVNVDPNVIRQNALLKAELQADSVAQAGNVDTERAARINALRGLAGQAGLTGTGVELKENIDFSHLENG